MSRLAAQMSTYGHQEHAKERRQRNRADMAANGRAGAISHISRREVGRRRLLQGGDEPKSGSLGLSAVLFEEALFSRPFGLGEPFPKLRQAGFGPACGAIGRARVRQQRFGAVVGELARERPAP